MDDERIRDLVHRAQNRDQAAFAELMSEYEGLLLYVLQQQLGMDIDDAYDVVGDTYILAWEALSTYHAQRARFRTWLTTIAFRRGIDLLRRRGVRVAQPLTELDETDPKSPNPHVEAVVEETVALVQRALRELAEDERALILQFHFEELSYQEIEALNKIPHTTLTSRLHRARHALRGILEREGIDVRWLGVREA